MLISQLRCVPVCFYCSISLCRCQYFVVLVCFRRQKVQRLHRCQIFRRYGGNGKFVVLQHPHNGLGPGQSTGVNFQQHKGGVLPDTAHLPIKIAAVCDVVRVVGDVYIAAPVGRAQAVEMKNCRCGNGCSCNGSFGFLFSIWLTELTISAPDPIPESSHLDVIKHFRNGLSL